MSVELITLIMLAGLLAVVLMGFPIGLALGGAATFFGVVFMGPDIAGSFMLRMFATFSDYILIAVPLFVFMGIVIEKAGIAGRLYDAMFVLFGRLRGGLAIATILTCTIFAAATGVVGATVTVMGLMSLPSMMKYKYNKPMACGSLCAGGALGILIPPSILILVYAPTANISVGALLIGAFIPGFILSMIYISYVAIRSYLRPQDAPAIDRSEFDKYTAKDKIRMFLTSVLPVAGLIFAVLGTIFFGLAAPTEAAALGAFFAVVLALCYKGLTWQGLKEACLGTVRTSAMVYMVMLGAAFFTSVFMRLGCGAVVETMIMGLGLGKYGILFFMWFIIILLGCFLDWIGIIMIVVPLFTPIAAKLGFDPVWFALMNIIVLQTSFLTPPFAYTIFYLKGIAPPEIKLNDMYRGVVPFLLLMLLAIAIFTIWPGIIMWAPKAAGLA